jgi:predicted N-acetyltransferase YhbS
MNIRFEEAMDAGSIHTVVREALAQATLSNGTEPIIVDKLRENGTLTVSLVAVVGADIVGHVAVSPVVVSEASGNWFGLGPVSVHPSRQGQGIGSALINQALEHLRNAGASGCVVLGEPNYYQRFGFFHDPDVCYREVPPPYFQILSFGLDRAAGAVEYDAAFEATG